MLCMYVYVYVCSEQLWRVALRVSHDAEGPTAKKAAAGRSEGDNFILMYVCMYVCIYISIYVSI